MIDPREEELIQRILKESPALREWVAQETLRDPDFAIGQAVQAAGDKAADKLMRHLSRASTHHARFDIENRLVEIWSVTEGTVVERLLKKLGRVRKNSDIAVSIVDILGRVGPSSPQATAKLLELIESNTIAGRFAIRVFSSYYAERPSAVVEGLNYLLFEEEKEVSTRVIKFVADHLLIYSRDKVTPEEAEDTVRSIWKVLDCSMGRDDFTLLASAILRYMTTNERYADIVENDACADMGDVIEREGVSEKLKRDYEVAKQCRNIVLDLFDEILNAKNSELGEVLDSNKITVFLCIFTTSIDEGTVSRVVKFVEKEQEILKVVGEEEREWFKDVFSTMKRFLRRKKVREFLPEKPGKGAGVARMDDRGFMHHRDFMRVGRNFSEHGDVEGCRQVVQRRKRQEVMRLF